MRVHFRMSSSLVGAGGEQLRVRRKREEGGKEGKGGRREKEEQNM